MTNTQRINEMLEVLEGQDLCVAEQAVQDFLQQSLDHNDATQDKLLNYFKDWLEGKVD